RRWEDVWYQGALVLSRVATDYALHKPSPAQVNNFLEEYRVRRAGARMRAWMIAGSAEEPYTCRYPDDDRAIYRTLRLLATWKWSLVEFLRHAIDEVKDYPDGLTRVAHRLDILTYRLDLSEEDALALWSGPGLEDDFQKWKKRAGEGKKRLWAALRDYRKPGTIYHGWANDSGLAWPEKNFELVQLELPGDVWNSRFFKTLVQPLPAAAGISTRGSSRLVARRIYDALTAIDPTTDFYPEQFYISFDFGQRMCDQTACWYCPFWKGKDESSLTPADLCAQKDGNLCGLLLATAGYVKPSDPGGCPLCREVT